MRKGLLIRYLCPSGLWGLIPEKVVLEQKNARMFHEFAFFQHTSATRNDHERGTYSLPPTAKRKTLPRTKKHVLVSHSPHELPIWSFRWVDRGLFRSILPCSLLCVTHRPTILGIAC